MNRCAVAGCEEAAWTKWRSHNLCKACSDAAWVWSSSTTSLSEAEAILARIADNLRKYGTRSGPEEASR
jgi:hypothetical protein